MSKLAQTTGRSTDSAKRVTVTFMDRVKAAKIVTKLRDRFGRESTAKILGVKVDYISTCEHKTKMKNHTKEYSDERFACPCWVIVKVLEYGKMWK